PGGLQMAQRRDADPDVAIGRRNGKRVDARQRVDIPHQRTVRIAVAEAPPPTLAPDAWRRVADITQPGLDRIALGWRQGMVAARPGGAGRRTGHARSVASRRDWPVNRPASTGTLQSDGVLQRDGPKRAPDAPLLPLAPTHPQSRRQPT